MSYHPYSASFDYDPITTTSSSSSFQSSIWHRQLLEEQQRQRAYTSSSRHTLATTASSSNAERVQLLRPSLEQRHTSSSSSSTSSSGGSQDIQAQGARACSQPQRQMQWPYRTATQYQQEEGEPLRLTSTLRSSTSPTQSHSRSRSSKLFHHPLRAGSKPRTQCSSSPASTPSSKRTPPTPTPTQALRTFTQGDAAILNAIRSKRTAARTRKQCRLDDKHKDSVAVASASASAASAALSPLDLFLKQRGVAVEESVRENQANVGSGAGAQPSQPLKYTRPHSPIQYLSPSTPTTSTSTSTAQAHHKYTVTLRGLQNHRVLQALQSSCNVSLCEDVDEENTTYDLKVHEERYVVFFKWALLPAAMSLRQSHQGLRTDSECDKGMDLRGMLRRQRQRGRAHTHTSTLVVLEAYSSSGIVLQSTPPLEAAREALQREVGADDDDDDDAQVRVLVRVAETPLHAARIARSFADGHLSK